MNLSLKLKMALSVSLLFILFSLVMTSFAVSFLQKELKEAIITQQFSLASSLALSIDNKLEMAWTAMGGATGRMTREISGDANAARSYLDSRPTLQSIFDDGLFLFSSTGRFIAESSYVPPSTPEERRQFEEFCATTISTGERHLSNLFLSDSTRRRPAIFMTVPVLDRNGKIYAILGGGINPHGRNFIQNLAQIRIGKSGYLYICDTDRTIIVHQDRSRIFGSVAPGTNPLLDRAAAGFDGSGITMDATGRAILTSFKHLGSTGWIVSVNLPVSEAYAPVETALRYLIYGSVAGTAAVLLAAWLTMRHLMAPLRSMTGHVAELMRKPENDRFCTIESNDELGTLAEAFNTMVDALNRQQNELKAAAATAQHEKARAEAVICAIGEALSMQDREFRIIFQNRACIEIKGDHAGEYCYDAYEGRLSVCPECAVAMVFADGNPHLLEKTVVVGGEKRDIEVTATPLRDSTGEIIAGIEIVRDVTVRKQHEMEIGRLNADLQKQRDELAAANSEQQAFGYSLSHDLKAPLTQISFAGQALSDLYAGELDDTGKFCIDSICKGSSRMAEMIDSMLLLSKISQRDITWEEVDLGDVALEILGQLRAAEPERNVSWTVARNVNVMGDPALLTSVMENLLSNAWKYTKNTPVGQIEFGIETRNGIAVIFVRDNGIGFEQTEAEKLFLPFQRTHTDDEFEGSGIGLATVLRIIKRHGGSIRAEGKPGEGAAFYFTLPAAGGTEPEGARCAPVA